MVIDILGFNVFSNGKTCLKKMLTGEILEVDKPCKIINCLNPHSYALSKNDAKFRHALLNCDVLLPDGVGISLAAKLKRKKIKRVTGFDVFEILMCLSNQYGLSVLFLGSTDDTLQVIREKIELQYPNIKSFSCYSPPFKTQFRASEKLAMVNFMKQARPDIIFVGMSAPKQEKLAFEFSKLVNPRCIASIGAVFDFYAGNVRRSPKIFRRLGLEWLPRLVQQPIRLAPRTFISAPIFLIDVFRAALWKGK